MGSSGVEVTHLGLGTAPLGGMFAAVSDEDAVATVAKAYELGLRFLDTAPLYGSGSSETRTGTALRDLGADDVVVATKVGRILRPTDDAPESIFVGSPPLEPSFDFSRDGVLRSLEASLDRLGLDRVDIVHIHDPDDHFRAAITEAYPALHDLRADGVIGAVGAGMNQWQMLARFAVEADFDCFLVAGRYTLLDQSALGELLPRCADRGISVICGGVYNSGLLAGGDTFDYAPAPASVMRRARRLAKVCSRCGVPLKAAAIRFPLGHPAVAAVVVGARSAAEIEENVRMFKYPIPSELWEELRTEGLLAPDAPTP